MISEIINLLPRKKNSNMKLKYLNTKIFLPLHLLNKPVFLAIRIPPVLALRAIRTTKAKQHHNKLKAIAKQARD